MEYESVAKKYAKAFLQITGISLENRSLYKESFRVITELFDVLEAKEILYSKVMPLDLKKDLIEYALRQVNHSQEFRAFLLMILEAKRVKTLPHLFRYYDEMICEANNLVLATVVSSCVLTGHETDEVRGQLAQLLGKEVHLTARVDKELLGGICLKYGNTQMDLSLRHKLDLLTAQVAL